MRDRPAVWRMNGSAVLLAAALVVAAAACGNGDDANASRDLVPTGAAMGDASAAVPVDRDDPILCKECHSSHYAEWSLSMHAFAGDDPVFRAMNARGQRETGGALGDFCVRCHAPVALARGATTDGTNLADLSSELRGVTCVACHTADVPDGSALDLTDDGVMRGPIADPVVSPAHASEYSRSSTTALSSRRPPSAARVTR